MAQNNLNKNFTKYICIASGPSLTKEDVEYIRVNRTDHAVMVVNDNYKLAPWAEFLYACDGKWWDVYVQDVKAKFKGECWTQEVEHSKKYDLNYIQGLHTSGLGKNGRIHYGSNSGYQAVNLCYLFGAKEIMLIGYDMKVDKNKKQHWFGAHPGSLNANSPYDSFARNFNGLACDLEKEKIKVINCTRDTALNCFKKQKLEEYLPLKINPA